MEIRDSTAWAIASKPAEDFKLNGLLIIKFENRKKYSGIKRVFSTEYLILLIGRFI